MKEEYAARIGDIEIELYKQLLRALWHELTPEEKARIHKAYKFYQRPKGHLE